jgi:cell division protein FtsL
LIVESKKLRENFELKMQENYELNNKLQQNEAEISVKNEEIDSLYKKVKILLSYDA